MIWYNVELAQLILIALTQKGHPGGYPSSDISLAKSKLVRMKYL